jgi:hypothetical protein
MVFDCDGRSDKALSGSYQRRGEVQKGLERGSGWVAQILHAVQVIARRSNVGPTMRWLSREWWAMISWIYPGCGQGNTPQVIGWLPQGHVRLSGGKLWPFVWRSLQIDAHKFRGRSPSNQRWADIP